MPTLYQPAYEDDLNFETPSNFEMDCIEGNIENVNHALLNASYEDKLLGFFRSLEHNQRAIALAILDHIKIKDLVGLRIDSGDPLLSEFHADYLSKIRKLQHYIFGFNPHVVLDANIAIVMAAAMEDDDVFDKLLSMPEMAQALQTSAIAAFLSATLGKTGLVKKDINQDIVFRLLELPQVHAYATSRNFDFSNLLRDFAENASAREETFTPISISTTSRSTAPTPFGFFELNRVTPRLYGTIDTPRPTYQGREDMDRFQPIHPALSTQTLCDEGQSLPNHTEYNRCRK